MINTRGFISALSLAVTLAGGAWLATPVEAETVFGDCTAKQQAMIAKAIAAECESGEGSVYMTCNADGTVTYYSAVECH